MNDVHFACRQLLKSPGFTPVVVLTSMLALLTLAGMQIEPPVVPEEVRNSARLRVDYGYCPGILVGLMNTNGPTYFCYGSVDLDGGPAVDEHTLFEMGSIGKVFTTTLLADMAQRRELELTDAIQAYLMYEFLGSYVLTRAPGATYEYSNFAMGLLGQLLVRKAGVGYQELVVTRIADELGLPDTRIELTPDQQVLKQRFYRVLEP